MHEPSRTSSEPCDIRDIVAKGWCTGCTTCVSVCPVHALAVQTTRYGAYVPVLDPQRCTQCGLCRKVCPAANENFHTLNEFVFGSIPQDMLLGHQQGCYLGYAADEQIRWQATSGGLVTALLLHLFDRHRIDGALLTRMAADDPLRAEPFIARSAEDVRSAIGSKYLPVPLNQLLRTVIEEPGRYAVVGLPCHLHGIRRAEMYLPILKERLVYHFGLVCSRTMNSSGWRLVLDKMGVDPNEVRELKFRGEGWPGGMISYLRNGERRFLPMLNTWWAEIFGAWYFSQSYCLLCPDVWAEYADLSFADAYLPEVLSSDKKGTSIVMARTPQGQHLLEEVIKNQVVRLNPLPVRRAVQSQLFMTLFKKRNLPVRIGRLARRGKSLPPPLTDRACLLKPTLWDWLIAWIPAANLRWSRQPAFGRVLRCVPLCLLKLYRQTFKWFLTRGAKEVLRSYE